MKSKLENYISKRFNNHVARAKDEPKKHVTQAEKLVGTMADPFIGTLEAVGGSLIAIAGAIGVSACGAAYVTSSGKVGREGVSLSAKAAENGAKIAANGTASAISAPFRAPYHGYKAHKHSNKRPNRSRGKVIGESTNFILSESFYASSETDLSTYEGKRTSIDNDLKDVDFHNAPPEKLAELNRQFQSLSKEEQEEYLSSLNEKGQSKPSSNEFIHNNKSNPVIIESPYEESSTKSEVSKIEEKEELANNNFSSNKVQQFQKGYVLQTVMQLEGANKNRESRGL